MKMRGVWVVCAGCGRAKPLPEPLWEMQSKGGTGPAWEKALSQLKCSKCGERKVWMVVDDHPGVLDHQGRWINARTNAARADEARARLFPARAEEMKWRDEGSSEPSPTRRPADTILGGGASAPDRETETSS